MKTILVVDDSRIMRNIVKNTFAELKIPCQYLEAADGKKNGILSSANGPMNAITPVHTAEDIVNTRKSGVLLPDCDRRFILVMSAEPRQQTDGNISFDAAEKAMQHISRALKTYHNARITFFVSTERDGYKSLTEQYAECMEMVALSDVLVKEGIYRYDAHFLLHGTEKKELSLEIKRSIQYINEHFAEAISVMLIAEQAGFTPNYLSTLFKKEMGIGVINYVHQCRVERAKALIANTNKKMHEIGGEVGFLNNSYFGKVFCKLTGVTPQKYKENLGKTDRTTTLGLSGEMSREG